MKGTPEDCPTCPGQEKLQPGYLEELIANKIRCGDPVVDEAEYEKRLLMCGVCPECLNGILCRMCGCLVPYRAVDERMDCPHPEGSRWTDE